MKSIAIVGTVGVPASYGGFETLAENLVKYADNTKMPVRLAVYCSGRMKTNDRFFCADLRYVPIKANGVASIFYDVVSLLSSIFHKDDVILLLGVSGAIALPFIRLVCGVRVITNIDGIEWERKKWSRVARHILRFSEYLAVKFSHEVITDNEGITEHVYGRYGRLCNTIAYGGDHAIRVEEMPFTGQLPDRYALALCRIEPENNIEMILKAFTDTTDIHLVFVGNWGGSPFGQAMRRKFAQFHNIHLIDPVYDVSVLKSIRAGAFAYIHGHSAGGTNPSLVEMMHFGIAVLAFDCIFNRFTTDDGALFFSSSDDLSTRLSQSSTECYFEVGKQMKKIASERYTWDKVGEEYFKLLLS